MAPKHNSPRQLSSDESRFVARAGNGLRENIFDFSHAVKGILTEGPSRRIKERLSRRIGEDNIFKASSAVELKKIMESEKLIEIALSYLKRAKRILANRKLAACSKKHRSRYISELEYLVKFPKDLETILEHSGASKSS